ncbi:MAG: hypothetical protein JRE64_05235, partial [Deltaproteobacteria bacterium]|nr:hypothetical protein [Deltaproteobacteria bacterium]
PQIQGSVLEISIDPNDPDIVYAGVADQGVFKTTNGGISWEKVYGGTGPIGASNYYNVIKINPDQPNIVYISGFTYYTENTLPGPFTSFPGSVGILPIGIYRSDDSGENWQNINTPDISLFFITDILLGLNDTLYVSTSAYRTPIFVIEDNHGVYKSEDNGNSWGPKNYNCAFDLSEFPILSIAKTLGTASDLISYSDKHIFISSDQAQNWITLPSFSTDTIRNVSLTNNRIIALTSDGIFQFKYPAVAFYLDDTDCDGLTDYLESTTCTAIDNPDTDGDGIIDGHEDLNHNGTIEPGETSPCGPNNLPPIPPYLSLPAYNAIIANPENIVLEWNSSTDPEGGSLRYCVTLKKDSEPDDIALFSGCDDALFVSETYMTLGQPLERGKTYWWAVWAVDDEGNFSPASEWWQFKVAEADWVPPVALQSPEIPLYDNWEIAPAARNLVFITHGWNSGVGEWPNQMKAEIEQRIEKARNEGLLNGEWEVRTYNWSKDASLPLTPAMAWYNAQYHGMFIGMRLAEKEYDHIHFLAHSAGSNLINAATIIIKNYNYFMPPTIHCTFFDSYTPLKYLKSNAYGIEADWAEHYVDTRPLFYDWADTTDEYYSKLFNFDVTVLDGEGWDDDCGLSCTIARHAWPYEYYQYSITDESNPLGYQLSLEAGITAEQFYANLQNYPRGENMILGMPTVVPNPSPSIEFKYQPVDSYIIEQITSSTGEISQSAPSVIELTTGSPAWISFKLELENSLNVLRFGYEFLSNACGLLSVYFDDEIIYKADEKYTPSGLNSTGALPIINTTPGEHVLTFRLDTLCDESSSLRVSQPEIGLMTATLNPNDSVIEVTIDIKPGSDPNCFNNDGHGVIPLAILGSTDFDCTQIAPSTCTLSGLTLKIAGKSNKLMAHIEDVNNDGFDDLVLQIEDQDGAFQVGESETTLTGNLYEAYGATHIQGTDSICIVP